MRKSALVWTWRVGTTLWAAWLAFQNVLGIPGNIDDAKAWQVWLKHWGLWDLLIDPKPWMFLVVLFFALWAWDVPRKAWRKYRRFTTQTADSQINENDGPIMGRVVETNPVFVGGVPPQLPKDQPSLLEQSLRSLPKPSPLSEDECRIGWAENGPPESLWIYIWNSTPSTKLCALSLLGLRRWSDAQNIFINHGSQPYHFSLFSQPVDPETDKRQKIVEDRQDHFAVLGIERNRERAGSNESRWELFLSVSLDGRNRTQTLQFHWSKQNGLSPRFTDPIRASSPRVPNTTAADWKSLQAEFDARSSTVMTLDADWSKEGDTDFGWQLRGDPSSMPTFEAMARRASKLALRSDYCRTRLKADILKCGDPMRLWCEAIRSLTGRFQMRDREMWAVAEDGTRIPHYSGYIVDVYGSSALLCLELQSREED